MASSPRPINPLTRLSTPDSNVVPFSRPGTPGINSYKIGWCGLGAMGYLMARNLATYRGTHFPNGPPLLIWNRTTSKAEQLAQELGGKAVVAKSLAEIATECDVIFTNLANDTVVKGVFLEFVEALKQHTPTRGKIFAETSTIYPTLAGELDILISGIPHAHLVTSPVFGAPAAANVAQLLVTMAGEYRAKKEVAHILVPAVGRKVVDLGGNLEKAPTFKLIGNSLILGVLEVLAEGFTLGEKAGIDGPVIHELIKELLPAPPIVAYGTKMVHDTFDGSKGFAIDGGIKDSNHILKLANDVNAPMPAQDAAHRNLLTARAIHAAQKARGDAKYDILDWSSLIAGPRVAAGLDGFDSASSSKVVPED